MLSKIFTIGLMTASIFLSGISLAVACKCAPPKSPLQYLKRVDAAFVGEVVRVKKANYRKYVKMKVLQPFKGINSTYVKIDTGMGGGDCGFYFLKDQKYLVYAYRKDNALKTGICTRTKHFDNAQNEIKVLSQQSSVSP